MTIISSSLIFDEKKIGNNHKMWNAPSEKAHAIQNMTCNQLEVKFVSECCSKFKVIRESILFKNELLCLIKKSYAQD